MIVKCPECNTSFNVPANLLGLDGRMVRCGRCQHQWRRAVTKEELLGNPDDEVAEETVEKVEEVEVEVIEPLPVLEESGEIIINPPTRNFIDKKFIAISFAVFLLLTIIFSLLFPMKIIQKYPQVYPIYKMLRLISSPIVVNPVDAIYRKDHFGQNILYIELELENITNKKQNISPLQVELYGEDGAFLKDWPLPARGNEIPKHGNMLLKFGLRDVPAGGKKIVIRRDLKKIYGIHVLDNEEENSDIDKPEEDKSNNHEDGGH